MPETLFYTRDIAIHFNVELPTVQEWFGAGAIEQADDASALSGQWVTTADKLLRAMGFEPLTLDAASRAQLLRPPVTSKEMAWLLSSPAKTLKPGSVRKRIRRRIDDPHMPGFLHFKLPGSKQLYVHRFDVDRKLKRATDRENWLRIFPLERKPSEKHENPVF
jgi:hypothetical protein